MSSRYAPPAVVLFLLALVPTVVHDYVGYKRSDGRRAEAIPETLAGMPSSPVASRTWSKPQFASEDAFEREYRSRSGTAVRLVVIRSYDTKALYHHPELAVAYGRGLSPAGRATLPGLPAVSVFVLRSETGAAPAHALFAVHGGAGFMDDPLRFQLRQSGALLLGGRQIATLFFAHAGTPLPERLERSAVADVLAAAIREFLAQADGS